MLKWAMHFRVIKAFSFLVPLVFYLSFVVSYLIYYFSIPKVIIASDLVSFLTGAEILKSGKAGEIYDKDLQYTYQLKVIEPDFKYNLLPFRGLPIVAWLFVPLSYLKLNSAFVLLILINIFILFLFNRISSKLFPKIDKLKYLFLITLFYWPTVSTMILGQFTLLLVLIFLLVYKYSKDKNYFLAGITSGVLLVKPQYLLFIPFLFFLIREKRKFIKGLLISSILIILVNISISGLGELLKYPSFIIGTETINYGSRPYHMFTLFALFKLTPNLSNIPQLTLVALNFIVYLLTLVLFVRRRRKISFDYAFVAGMIFTVLFSVHALVHDLLILLVPIFILLNLVLKRGEVKLSIDKILIGLLFFLPTVILFGYTLWAIVLLIFCGYFLTFFLQKATSNNQISVGPI